MAPETQERRKPTVMIVMFLIYYEGKVLIEERIRPDSSYKGFFITPAGHIEDGESPEGAVKRETKEEHDITPTEFELLDEFENVSLSGEFGKVFAYLVTKFEGIVQNNEPKKCNLHWMTLDEAIEKTVLASDHLVLSKAKQVLSRQY